MRRSSRWAALLAPFVVLMSVGATPAFAAPSAVAAGAESVGSIRGTVQGPGDGAFLPDERVVVELTSPNWDTHVVASTEADEHGAFHLDVPSGEYLLRFRYLGERPILDEWWGDAYRSWSAEHVLVDPGATSEADVRLELGGTVSGSIRGSDGPLPWANIWASPWRDEAFGRPDISIADGRYSITSLPPDEYGILFSSGQQWYYNADHNGVRTVGYETSEPRLHVGLGEWVVRDIVLVRKASISGTVSVDRNGEIGSIEGVRAYAMKVRADGSLEFISPSTQTDSAGRYELTGLLPGEYVVGFDDPAEARVFERYWPDANTSADATRLHVDEISEVIADIDPILESAARVRGAVEYRSPNGDRTPLPGTSIVAWRLDDESGEYELIPDAIAPAGSDATFLSPQLRPGRYALYFHHDDHDDVGGEYYQDARYFVERTDVDLRPGETLDLGKVVLDQRYFDVGRIAGADRYATAVEISRTLVPDDASVPVVYIANGTNYPDALAAVPAASVQAGVMLLVPADGVPESVAAELRRIDPERIVVVGGEAVVGAKVFASLGAYVDDPADLSRIGGANRYETADAIVRDAFGGREVARAFIATGAGFADALAAGAAAGNAGAPVVLVDGGAPTLSAAARKLLAELDLDEVYIAGGPSAVSPGIEQEIAVLVGGAENVTRLGGADRYETATIIDRAFFDGSDYALLSIGTGFADALAGGPLAASLGAPLYLTRPDCIPAVAAADMVGQGVAGVILLGGTAVLGPAVEDLVVCQ